MSSKRKKINIKSGHISIRGARTNNLKGIDVDIPYHELVVITGISGSGKSSLGFSTLFAEGCSRYIESFTTHARQFLEKIKRPPVDAIQGVLPSVALSRKNTGNNPQSRIAITTGLYTYMKLLFVRLGKIYSPISGQLVHRNDENDLFDFVQSCEVNTPLLLLASLHVPEGQSWKKVVETLLSKGFIRVFYKGEIVLISDAHNLPSLDFSKGVHVVIDRFKRPKKIDNPFKMRVIDSARTAFFEGQGKCFIEVAGKRRAFSHKLEADGMTFEEPSLHTFSFNSLHGSCQKCRGLGTSFDIDPAKVIPNESLSIRGGAVAPWQHITTVAWGKDFVEKGAKIGFPMDTPYQDLSKQEQKLLWNGEKSIDLIGIREFFDILRHNTAKAQYTFIHSSYRGLVTCNRCLNTGLKDTVHHIKIGGKNIIDLILMPIDNLATFIANLTLPPHQEKVGKILLEEIKNRLYYLQKVGLGYLTLNRRTYTLSGGEYQRVRLARILGSPLVDNLYVLDEPTAGLHERDAEQLLQSLILLKKAGNTIVVVGHKELVMRAAHNIIDIGPEAGKEGGHLVFQGNWEALSTAQKSYTADYLIGRRQVVPPLKTREWQHAITIKQCSKHNLKNVNVSFPLGIFTVVTGVSGSGKSTLVNDILHTLLYKHCYTELHHRVDKVASETLEGDIERVTDVIYMGQNALRKSSRSNLATYLEIHSHIRELFASQPLAVERHYIPSHFSTNTQIGSCPTCQGEGSTTIDMQFMEDVVLVCEDCRGDRFEKEVLEIRYSGKNIIEVLSLTVEEALTFFKQEEKITKRLKWPLHIGLGKLQLGQTTSTLSSGEAQRLKLSFYLNEENRKKNTFFIFDEPSIGLHFHDINKLLHVFQTLVEQGNTVLVVEHNMDVIKCADWVIDLGPEGGVAGGQIVFTGPPNRLLKVRNNHTAEYLRRKVTQDLKMAKKNKK